MVACSRAVMTESHRRGECMGPFNDPHRGIHPRICHLYCAVYRLTMRRFLLACLVFAVIGSSILLVRAEMDATIYSGCCDASAAVAVDDRHFVVADDEDNILRVYERSGGSPVMQIDLTQHLGTKKKADEADLEGGALVDEIIYWIGSHGRNSKGKDSPMRRRIIATRVGHARGGLQIEPVSKPYTTLLEDLIADKRFDDFGFESAAAKAPKSEGALNIEGLTATPDGPLPAPVEAPFPLP